jgi:hypothetical protein
MRNLPRQNLLLRHQRLLCLKQRSQPLLHLRQPQLHRNPQNTKRARNQTGNYSSVLLMPESQIQALFPAKHSNKRLRD